MNRSIRTLGVLAVAFALAGCATGPRGGEGGRRVWIREFDARRVAASAAHMNLGVTAEAILAEQWSLTKGIRLVLPEKTLEKRRLAWERRAENSSRPIPVEAGEGEAEVRGELTVEGVRLTAVTRFLEGGREVPARVEWELGEPERNNLFFRELALRLLTAVEPSNARAWVRLGITLREEGLVSQAVETYRKAVALEPTLASAHFNMGLAFDAMGDVDSAIEAFRKAVEADPAHAGAKYSWALDDLREREAGESRERFQRRVLRATELFRQVLALAPRNKEARYLLVEGLAMLGQTSAALEECGRIQRIFPGDGRVYEVRGNLYLRWKRFREALVEFRKLEALEPSLITNAYFLGAALEGLGRLEEAAGRYEEFAEKSGDDPKFEKARENARKKIETLRAGVKDGEDR